MYSLGGYGDMVADRVRMDAYAAAIQKTVKPGDVVVDLGCGFGIMALLACRAGAARVYAVEPDNIITLGRELARANGVADRISFIQASSLGLELPERADVIVSDLRGVLPWCTRHLPTIMDVRQRWLKSGGVQIPRRDMVYAAPVNNPEGHDKLLTAWRAGFADFDLSAGLRRAVNQCGKARVRQEALLATAQCWAQLDYTALTTTSQATQLEFVVAQAGPAHGLLAWFDAELVEGVKFSNAPGAPPAIYGQMFFPWPEAVTLASGDRVAVEIGAHFVNGDYVFRWDSAIHAGGAVRRFTQSSFHAALLSPERLRREAGPGSGAAL